MPPPLNLTGQPFGRLAVLCAAGHSAQYGGCRLWLCRCTCGVEIEVPQVKLQRGYDACDDCRTTTCAICGAPLLVREKRTACDGDCERERAARASRASYERNKAAVIQRAIERAKRERAAGNPVYREQGRRKYARLKADPEKMASERQQAREWYARNRERILAERAARRTPLPPRVCESCGVEFVPQRRDAIHCTPTCRHVHRPLLPRACAICGGEFVPVHTGRLTCSDACRAERHRQQIEEYRQQLAIAPLGELATQLGERLASAEDRRVPCRCCGALFLPRGRRRKFCSPVCREYWREQSTRMRPCVICAKEFQGRKRNDKTCSPDCRAGHKRRAATARLNGAPSVGQVPCRCGWCGKDFLGHRAARYCSTLCLQAAKQERERERVNRESYACAICGKSMADADLKINRYTCSAECRREALRRKQRRSYLNRKERQRAPDQASE